MCESNFSISPLYHTWNEEFLCIPPVVEESRHSYITYCIVDLCCFKQDIESSCRKLGCNWTIQVVVIILWRLPIKGTVNWKRREISWNRQYMKWRFEMTTSKQLKTRAFWLFTDYGVSIFIFINTIGGIYSSHSIFHH